MEDVHVTAGPGVPKGLIIPNAELVEQFSHSSGPGGQHVNTADSRVQLHFDLATTTALNETQRTRALKNLATRLTGTVLTVTSASHRSQYRNRRDARQRLGEILRAALAPEVRRRPTKPTRGSQRRRLKAKKIRSEIKQNRQRPPRD